MTTLFLPPGNHPIVNCATAGAADGDTNDYDSAADDVSAGDGGGYCHPFFSLDNQRVSLLSGGERRGSRYTEHYFASFAPKNNPWGLDRYRWM